MPWHRKTTRLRPQYYLGTKFHFVTICCDRRQAHLADPTTAAMVIDRLLDCARRCSFVLHAYCLMPDHLHVLAQGIAPTADLTKLIRTLKSRTAFAFRRAHEQRLWEMSYYEHILRSSDSPNDVAQYIWTNPVRKHLCATAPEFRFSGSQTVPWKTQSISTQTWAPPWTKNPPV